jgi:hypothetical protein
MEELEKYAAALKRSKPATEASSVLKLEFELAWRMAMESCHLMLWQQALAAGKKAEARKLAKRGITSLSEIDAAFNAYWPTRTKGDTGKSTGFLKWRIEDYKKGILHFPPEVAQPVQPKTYAAE